MECPPWGHSIARGRLLGNITRASGSFLNQKFEVAGVTGMDCQSVHVRDLQTHSPLILISIQ